jgi:ABC-type Zn uptake system ZnuABC Zn-binding protein ZnuA
MNIEKKLINIFKDFSINFENNKKLYSNNIKILIEKFQIKINEKSENYSISLIGCGGRYSWIYNKGIFLKIF